MEPFAHLSRWSLRFKDEALERAFGDFDASGELALQRWLAGVDALFFLSAWAVASWRFGVLETRFNVLLFVVGVNTLLYIAGSYTRWAIKHRNVYTLGGMIALAASLPSFFHTADAAFARLMITVPLLTMITNAVVAYRWRAKLVFNAVLLAWSLGWAIRSGRYPVEEQVFLVHVYMLVFALATALSYVYELGRRRRFLAERRAQEILTNVLPASVAERLIAAGHGAPRVVDRADHVAVIFADIVGFTPFAAARGADEVVAMLDMLFARFDTVVQQHGLEKIKTIGDAYMAVAGLPAPRPDAVLAALATAEDLLAAVERLRALGAVPFSLRIGVHVGPAVAGVIGRQRFLYDLWGDTVNVAARLESTGEPGRIHVSSAVVAAAGPARAFDARGRMHLKGKGEVETFFVALSGTRSDQPRRDGAPAVYAKPA